MEAFKLNEKHVETVEYREDLIKEECAGSVILLSEISGTIEDHTDSSARNDRGIET